MSVGWFLAVDRRWPESTICMFVIIIIIIIVLGDSCFLYVCVHTVGFGFTVPILQVCVYDLGTFILS